MFLEILGFIFLVIIGLVVYFVFKFYRLAKNHQNSGFSLAISVLPAQDMELEPSNAEEWKEKERLAFTESELKRVGSSHIGYFCVYNGYAIIRVSMWSVKDKVVAVIYEAESSIDEGSVQFLFEVAAKTSDGSLCITSNVHADLDSRPNNHILYINESPSIIEFIKSIKPLLPIGQKLLRIKDPKAFFLECYEETTEWSWRTEQLRSSKTKQVLSSVGVEVTEELMEELEEIGLSYSIDVSINRARRKLSRHSKMNVEQWENIRDKLVFINEKMRVEHLIDAIYEISGELTDTQEKTIEGFQINTTELVDSIAAFQMLVQSLNLRVRRVTSIDAPDKTEVYLPA